MPRFIYSKEMLSWLRREHKRVKGFDKIAAAFNQRFGVDKTASQIMACIKNHRMLSGRKQSVPRPDDRLLTPAQEIWLREHYKTLSVSDMTPLLNRTFGLSLTASQIRSYTKNHNIKSGRAGTFEKGSKAWNAGTKGVMKKNAGSFKKGHTPPNRKKVGDERICSKDGYVIIKTAETDPHTGHFGYWRHKHIVLWEKHHGPVEDGKIIVFKNSNINDLRIENLEQITRGEHAIRNKMHYRSLPDEIKPVVATLAKVTIKQGQRLNELRK